MNYGDSMNTSAVAYSIQQQQQQQHQQQQQAVSLSAQPSIFQPVSMQGTAMGTGSAFNLAAAANAMSQDLHANFNFSYHHPTMAHNGGSGSGSSNSSGGGGGGRAMSPRSMMVAAAAAAAAAAGHPRHSLMMPTGPLALSASHSLPMLTGGFPVKPRHRTTKLQFSVLERHFRRNPRPDAATRDALAAKLSMRVRTVQIWFQNRRAKSKRDKQRGRPTPPMPAYDLDLDGEDAEEEAQLLLDEAAMMMTLPGDEDDLIDPRRQLLHGAPTIHQRNSLHISTSTSSNSQNSNGADEMMARGYTVPQQFGQEPAMSAALLQALGGGLAPTGSVGELAKSLASAVSIGGPLTGANGLVHNWLTELQWPNNAAMGSTEDTAHGARIDPLMGDDELEVPADTTESPAMPVNGHSALGGPVLTAAAVAYLRQLGLSGLPDNALTASSDLPNSSEALTWLANAYPSTSTNAPTILASASLLGDPASAATLQSMHKHPSLTNGEDEGEDGGAKKDPAGIASAQWFLQSNGLLKTAKGMSEGALSVLHEQLRQQQTSLAAAPVDSVAAMTLKAELSTMDFTSEVDVLASAAGYLDLPADTSMEDLTALLLDDEVTRTNRELTEAVLLTQRAA